MKEILKKFFKNIKKFESKLKKNFRKNLNNCTDTGACESCRKNLEYCGKKYLQSCKNWQNFWKVWNNFRLMCKVWYSRNCLDGEEILRIIKILNYDQSWVLVPRSLYVRTKNFKVPECQSLWGLPNVNNPQ